MSDYVLQPVGVLSFLSERRVASLQPYGEFCSYEKDQVVIDQNNQSTTLYIVIQGRLEVVRTMNDVTVSLGEVGSGDCIGEISLFEPSLTTASIKALEPVVTWSMGLDGLQNFMRAEATSGAQLLLGITQLLSRRLKLANETIASKHVLPNHLCVRRENLNAVDGDKWLEEDRKGFQKLTGKSGEYKISNKIKL
ncbi:MAG: cyclic nucleotide-binding domain-containing protein [Verrucomicrobiota bacterium]